MTEGNNRTHPAKIILKTIGWFLLTVTAIGGAAIGTAGWLLSPRRLAATLDDLADKHLNAEIKTGQIRISVLKRFPKVNVEIDSIVLISHSIGPSIRQRLDTSVDTLASLGRLTGSFDLLKAVAGEIDIDRVELTRPRINMVSVNDTVNNYDIIDLTDSKITAFPDITLRDFAITAARPFTYTNLADSSKVCLLLADSKIISTTAPDYHLSTDAKLITTTARGISISNISLGLEGIIRWRHDDPYRIDIDRLVARAGEVNLKGALQLSLDDPVTVTALNIDLGPASLESLLEWFPEQIRYSIGHLETDLMASARLRLVKPHAISSGHLPTVDFDITIPEGKITRNNNYTVERFECHATGRFNGTDPDKSTIDLRRLRLNGRGVTASIEATITNPLSDVTFDGHFDGRIDFNVMPRFIRAVLPMSLKGEMAGATDFRFSMSDLCLQRLHRIKLNGNLRLARFTAFIPADTLTVGCDRASLSLRSPTDPQTGDSLLRANLSVNHGRLKLRNLSLDAANLRCRVATLDAPTSPDRSIINPVDVTINADSVSLKATASSLRLKNIDCHSELKRYHDRLTLPLLSLRLSTDSIDYRTTAANATLASCEIDVNAHLSRLSTDTAGYVLPIGEDLVDFGLSRTLRRLIATWGAQGSIKASRGTIFTPSFPIQANVAAVNISFTPDEVSIKGIDCHAGNSDLHLDGNISNLRRALSVNDRSPLKIGLTIKSDTLDLNQLARVAFAAKSASPPSSEPTAPEQADTGAIKPLLLPLNLSLAVNLETKAIMYYDVMLYELGSDITLNNGRIDIGRLEALTDMGNVNLQAFYDAPRADAMSFGADAKLQKVDIKQMLHLIPYVDSILPMMKDFGGMIDAHIAGSTLIDTSMCMDKKSIKCDIELQGHGLTITGIKKIKKWEKLLPKRDRPLTVKELSVDIKIADGEMDVYPYMIDADGWLIAASESDNGNGDIDVKLAFLHSAVPWKWGFEFDRHNHHNHIHFSGPKLEPWKVARRYSLAPYHLSMLHYIDKVTTEGTKAAREGHIAPGQTNPHGKRKPTDLSY